MPLSFDNQRMDGSLSEYLHLSEKTEHEFISFTDTTNISIGDIAAIVYLWNPFTIVSCVGGCTSPIENAMVILSLYGAVAGGDSTFLPFIPDTKAYGKSQFLCKYLLQEMFRLRRLDGLQPHIFLFILQS